jgi:peptidase M42 family hydrolase
MKAKEKKLNIDKDYLLNHLINIINIPSMTGYTDGIVHYVGEELKKLGIAFEITRRGAIRADLKGKRASPDRAIVAHLDTIGAMVRELKSNGRLSIVPIGNWSSRFAEGSRVTIFTDTCSKRGSVLPLKASGHAYNHEIDLLPISWDNVEVRVDDRCNSIEDLLNCGYRVGDFISFDPNIEVLDTGFVVARHLDGKAGTAATLTAAKAILESSALLPVDCHLLFTISEEVGSGASAVLHQDVVEMLTVDMAPVAPVQNTSEYGVTIVMKDASGPFDYHLLHKLTQLCQSHNIEFKRDILNYYYCDSASAIEAGSDIRTALIGYGIDASHGYERVHMDSLYAVTEVLTIYAQSDPTFLRDEDRLGPLEGFPTQPD